MGTQLNGTLKLMKYMEEREYIRMKKEAGEPPPWTDDWILNTYKFTNVKRANDRTTKTFLEFYQHASKPSRLLPREQFARMLLYNCGVARYFGTVAMAREALWLEKHDARRLRAAVKRVQAGGENVFTGAYVVTSGGKSGPKSEYVIGLLGGLWKYAPNVMAALEQLHSWRAAYEVLSQIPGFGGSGFMAKEVLQDVLLMWDGEVTDAETWTPMGPGARRGMNRLMGRPVRFRQPESKYVAEVQDVHGPLQVWWRKLFNAVLTAHDVQFCLCEFDKYERTRAGEGRPKAKYTMRSEGSTQ